jgi:hypothetical protein
MKLEQSNASMLLINELLPPIVFPTITYCSRFRLPEEISLSHETEESLKCKKTSRAYPAVATSGVGLNVSVVVAPRRR